MKTSTSSDDKGAPSPPKSKKTDKIEESIQESQSLSQSKDKDNKTKSYDTSDSYSQSMQDSS